MKNIPCKEEKCILYPICTDKTEIRCDPLLDYFRLLEGSKEDTDSTWETIQTAFPKLVFIEPEKYDTSSPDYGEVKILTRIRPFPCIEEKCLKYPACISKTKIICPSLNKLFCYMYDNLNPQQMWQYVRQYFPKLKQVAESSKTPRSFTIGG